MKSGIVWLAIATTAIGFLGGSGCTTAETSSSAPPAVETTPEPVAATSPSAPPEVEPEPEPEEETAPATTLGDRNDYRPFDLNNLPPDADLTGGDPEEIALQLFGISEPVEGPYREEISRYDNNPQRPVVIFMQMGLADDSVKGMKYRLDFESAGQEQWRLDWVGQQYTCYRGRTDGEWHSDLCP